MNSFKQAAIEILKQSEKPLHYKEITNRALKQSLFSTTGKTPWATMIARISMDIVENGTNSTFVRVNPGEFVLNKQFQTKPVSLQPKIIINENISTKQKGDITEARVAELVTLYGDEGLSCYKPISDDEGIDLIVKRRGKLEVVYVQVKSTYGNGRDKGFVCGVKEKNLKNKQRMLIVFVYFDLSQGDLFDHVFCIPAPEFLKLSENKNNITKMRMFTVGLNNPDKSKWAEFMIEKRELANKITEIMDRL